MNELNGVDLARQTLVAAREAAKKNGGAPHILAPAPMKAGPLTTVGRSDAANTGALRVRAP